MAPDGKALPYLDGLDIRQVAEDSTKVLQIQSGSLNGTEGLPWSQVGALQSDTRGQLILLPQQQIYFMVLNLTKPPFDDVKVRQAMSLALDRQGFVDRATAGKADVANSFMPKSGLCWNANSKLPYDLEPDKALIAQSKYPNGFSGAKLQLTSGAQVGRDAAVNGRHAAGSYIVDIGSRLRGPERDDGRRMSISPGPIETPLDVTIITGMSGAGRSEAAHVLEDLGFFVIDNLPPMLIGKVAELARGRYLFFLNNDTLVPPLALRRLLDYAEAHPDVGMIGPRLRDGRGRTQVSCRRRPTLGALLHRLILLRWTGLRKRQVFPGLN